MDILYHNIAISISEQTAILILLCHVSFQINYFISSPIVICS